LLKRSGKEHHSNKRASKLKGNNNILSIAMIIVCTILNNSLGAVEEVQSYEDAKKLVMDLFHEKFGRPLNDIERDQLEDLDEVYNDDDHDNHWTFSIGLVEEL